MQKQIQRQFLLDLTQSQMEFLNCLLSNEYEGYSLQKYQKVEKRKKTQKKLDQMYVSDFSLKPTKKAKSDFFNEDKGALKIMNASSKQHNQKLNKQILVSSSLSACLINVQEQHQQSTKKQQLSQILIKKIENQNEEKQQQMMEIEIERPLQMIKSSRSQRVSKPTQVYMQFQSETFRKKFPEKLNESNVQIESMKDIENISMNSPMKKESKKKVINNVDDIHLKEQKILPEQNNIYGQINKISEQKQQQNRSQIPEIKQIQGNQMNSNDNQNKSINYQVNQPLKIRQTHYNDDLMKRLKEKKSQLPSLKEFASEFTHKKNTSFVSRCYRMLQKLKVHKSSWPFRRPVDPISQGVPEYFNIIKNPMDLRTIQKKLKSHKYKHQSQFFKDIMLMFENSYVFNPVQSKYYKLTKQLQGYFNQIKSRISHNLRSNSNKNKSSQQNHQHHHDAQSHDNQDDFESEFKSSQSLQQDQDEQQFNKKKNNIKNSKDNNDLIMNIDSFNKKQKQNNQIVNIINNLSVISKDTGNNQMVKKVPDNLLSSIVLLSNKKAQKKQRIGEGEKQNQKQSQVNIKKSMNQFYNENMVDFIHAEELRYDILQLRMDNKRIVLQKIKELNKIGSNQNQSPIQGQNDEYTNNQLNQKVPQNQIELDFSKLRWQDFIMLRKFTIQLMREQKGQKQGSGYKDQRLVEQIHSAI